MKEDEPLVQWEKELHAAVPVSEEVIHLGFMSLPEIREITVRADEPSPDHVLFDVTVKGGRVECVWCGPQASVGVDITGDLMCNDCKRYVPHPTDESTEYNA